MAAQPLTGLTRADAERDPMGRLLISDCDLVVTMDDAGTEWAGASTWSRRA